MIPCNIGVRQGENLSPLLFLIYLQNLKSFISRGLKGIEHMQREHLDEEIVTHFKLYILLYADDTVILAENPNDLQASLNEMKSYCDTFDLHINVNKTKILFFSRGKLRKHHIINFSEHILDTVDEYNYLGLVFNYNAKFKIAKSHLYQNGRRAMFCPLKKARKLSFPLDIMLKLFNVIVKPVVLYGAKIWGSENCDILERLLKYVLSVNKFTSSMMVYGELGVVPLDVDIILRMLTYWARLCLGDKHKIFNTIYSLLYTLDEKNIYKSEWIQTVKTTLNYCGFSVFWLNQTLPCSIEAFKQSVKLRLKDQFIQKWQESISQRGKCTIYRIIKTTFGFENYLNDLPDLLRKYFTSLDAEIIACP